MEGGRGWVGEENEYVESKPKQGVHHCWNRHPCSKTTITSVQACGFCACDLLLLRCSRGEIVLSVWGERDEKEKSVHIVASLSSLFSLLFCRSFAR